MTNHLIRAAALYAALFIPLAIFLHPVRAQLQEAIIGTDDYPENTLAGGFRSDGQFVWLAASGNDLFWARLDETGEIIAQRRWAPQNWLWASGGLNLQNGEMLAFGLMDGFATVVKFDEEGGVAWTIGFSGRALPVGGVNASGNYWIAFSEWGGTNAIQIMEISPDGELLRQLEFRTAEEVEALDLTVGSDGAIWLAGFDRDRLNSEAFIARLDPVSLTAQYAVFGSPQQDVLRALAPDAKGGVAAGGASAGYKSNGYWDEDGNVNHFILRFDKDFTLDWAVAHDGVMEISPGDTVNYYREETYDLHFTDDDRLAALGSKDYYENYIDMHLVFFDYASGAYLDEYRLGGMTPELGLALSDGPDGALTVWGENGNSGQGYFAVVDPDSGTAPCVSEPAIDAPFSRTVFPEIILKTGELSEPELFHVSRPTLNETTDGPKAVSYRTKPAINEIVVHPISCPGEEDGAVEIHGASDLPGFLYFYAEIYEGQTVDETFPREQNQEEHVKFKKFEDLKPGYYLALLGDKNWCVDTTFFTIDSIPEITLDAPELSTKCPAETLTITLEPAGGTPPLKITEATESATPLTTAEYLDWQTAIPGLFTFEVEDAKGCKETFEIEVRDRPQPIAGATDTFDLPFAGQQARPEQLSGGEPDGGRWSGPGISDPEGAFNTDLVSGEGEYEVYYERLGCVDTKQVVVRRRYYDVAIPSVFTPNGDGANDVFFMQARNFANIQLKVFDARGALIHTGDGTTSHGWNGRANGGEAPAGVYFFRFVMTAHDGNQAMRAGSVTLLR